MKPNYNFDTKHIKWTRMKDPDVGYPCDYELAVLGADPTTGRLDLMVKWPPDTYCHLHRHVADTTLLVLEGEQHIIVMDDNGTEGIHKVRPAGTYVSSPSGEAHMERGGPEGATIFFAMQSKDGRIFETLDKDMNVLATATIENMLDTLLSD